jgi:heptose I phosphotransferase
MSGGFLDRLVRGTRRSWTSERHRRALPADLVESAMAIASTDRYHAKQGRSTARVRFDGPDGPLSVYLKRHDRLPWSARLAALLHPEGDHSPATTERRHLERARALGIAVPEVVAAGEEIGPWGRLRGFLMVAELVGADEVNLVVPRLAEAMNPADFARFKREVIAEMAAIAARLHGARLFHKDLYLCHYFLDPTRPAGLRLTLIDLHRLARHRWTAWRWRRKDLAQLLYSTEGVAGIDDRDRLRFWMHYRRRMDLRWPGFEARAALAKAARYRSHNRPNG